MVPSLRNLRIRSRLGDITGRTDGVVAAFDHAYEPGGPVMRHYLLLDESVKLMHEPWGWRDCWQADLVAIGWADDATIDLDDLYIDVIVEGNGPTYRMIDLDDLADALASGKVCGRTLHEPLRGLQRFLDAHLHGGKDFPPRCLRPFLPDSSTAKGSK